MLPPPTNSSLPLSKAGETQLIFPGGGVYFWWQAGVVKALQQSYDLTNSSLSISGASAGSIAAVMAICEVDQDNAMKCAIKLADEAGVFTRPGGLSGIWGGLIKRWLEELLPEDCHVICSGKVHISVTSLTVTLVPLHRHVINTFHSKSDLIDACLASVHIPFFIDGNFSHEYRGDRCLDGSILFVLHNSAWCKKDEFGENQGAYIFNHCHDKKLMEKKWGFLETISKDAFSEMFSLGHEYGLQWVKRQNKYRPPKKLESVWSYGDR
jgi:hypothetical protein